MNLLLVCMDRMQSELTEAEDKSDGRRPADTALTSLILSGIVTVRSHLQGRPQRATHFQTLSENTRNGRSADASHSILRWRISSATKKERRRESRWREVPFKVTRFGIVSVDGAKRVGVLDVLVSCKLTMLECRRRKFRITSISTSP
jgi:hypothetical protein